METKEAILSVDDLVMKIGGLTVEKLELEKKVRNLMGVEEELKKTIAKGQDLKRQLDEALEELSQERLRIKELEKRLESYQPKQLKSQTA